jgi:hypothetical protein
MAEKLVTILHIKSAKNTYTCLMMVSMQVQSIEFCQVQNRSMQIKHRHGFYLRSHWSQPLISTSQAVRLDLGSAPQRHLGGLARDQQASHPSLPPSLKLLWPGKLRRTSWEHATSCCNAASSPGAPNKKDR